MWDEEWRTEPREGRRFVYNPWKPNPKRLERERARKFGRKYLWRERKREDFFFSFLDFLRGRGERERGRRQMADSSDSVSIDMETISLGGKVMHLRLKVGGCLVSEKMWAMGRNFFERQEFLVFWDRRKRWNPPNFLIQFR